MSTVEKVVYLERVLAGACAHKDWKTVDRLRIAVRVAQLQAERAERKLA